MEDQGICQPCVRVSAAERIRSDQSSVFFLVFFLVVFLVVFLAMAEPSELQVT